MILEVMVIVCVVYKKLKKRIRIANAEHSASLTVEASIIVPIITMIIFMIIYFTFYLHDRVKFESQMHTISLDASNLIQYSIDEDGSLNDYNRSILYLFLDNKSKENKVLKERITETFESGLFIGTLDNISIEWDIANISYHGNLLYRIPFLNFFGLFSGDTIKIPFHIKAAIFPREETTRIIDTALRTGESIKGVSNAIDKVVEVLNSIRK